MHRSTWKPLIAMGGSLALALLIGVAAVRAAASVRVKAIEEVVQSGGMVVFECQATPDPSGSAFARPENVTSAGLRQTGRICDADWGCVPCHDAFTYLFGDRFVHSPVVYIDFTYNERADPHQVTDQVVLKLKEFPTLKRVLLDYALDVTDRGVAVVEFLPRLERLFLDDVEITDLGLESIATCKNLEYLAVGSDSITDDGLKQLRGLANLQHLYVHGDNVTGAFLKSLAGCRRLEHVGLGGARIEAAALEEARALMPLVGIYGPARTRVK